MTAKNGFHIKIVGRSGAKWGKICIFGSGFHIRKTGMRFLGNMEAKVDAKGRVFFPAAFRKELQSAGCESMVMRKDVFQQCLVLYPEPVWNEEMDTLRRRLSRWNKKHQHIYRQFVSDVEIEELDGNGRILIPRRYLALAGIEQCVRFIGMGDTVEIWSSAACEKPFMEPEEFGKALEGIMGGGDGGREAQP